MPENYRPLNLSISVHPDAATRVSHDVLTVTENGQTFATVEIGDALVRVIFLSYSADALRIIGEEFCRAATDLCVAQDRAKLAKTYDILNRVTYAGEPDAPR